MLFFFHNNDIYKIISLLLLLFRFASANNPNSKSTTLNNGSKSLSLNSDTKFVSSDNDISFRITNGRPVNADMLYPIVSIQQILHGYREGRGHFCGGSIIGPYQIVTAAHCFHTKSNFHLYAIIGLNNIAHLPGPDSIYGVSDVVIHNDYDLETETNDIAIIFVNRKISTFLLRQCQVPLASYIMPLDTGCILLGWGNKDLKSDPRTYLYIGMLSIIPKSACRLNDDDTQICGYGESDACLGDSGGPLICDELLTGIVSYGWNCGKFPGVYTDVYLFREWITQMKSAKPFIPNDAESNYGHFFFYFMGFVGLCIIIGIIYMYKTEP